MRKFTKEQRQRILDDFAARHGGVYDPAMFLREVRSSNGTHEAWSWFEWNDGKAAEEHRLWQARTFVQGLKISFEVVTEGPKPLSVRVAELPAYVSPIDRRSSGGGYDVTDPQNEAHRAEIARQGILALKTWERRYGGIYQALGGDLEDLNRIALILETAMQEVA